MAVWMPHTTEILRGFLLEDAEREFGRKEPSPIMGDNNPKAARATAEGKLRLDLIDTAMTHPTSRVLAHGADKYGKRNWRVEPIYASTYVAALRRHIDAWADGLDADLDSGEHPLAHVSATVDVVLDALKHGTLVDDREAAESKSANQYADDERADDELTPNATRDHAAEQPGTERHPWEPLPTHRELVERQKLGRWQPMPSAGNDFDSAGD